MSSRVSGHQGQYSEFSLWTNNPARLEVQSPNRAKSTMVLVSILICYFLDQNKLANLGGAGEGVRRRKSLSSAF